MTQKVKKKYINCPINLIALNEIKNSAVFQTCFEDDDEEEEKFLNPKNQE